MATVNRKTLFLIPVICIVCALACAPVFAMPPPSDEELEMYRLDGTLQERIDYAAQFDTTKLRDDLVTRANYRLRRMLGMPVPEGAPPPAWHNMPTKGTVNMFVLCIDFADYPAFNTIGNIENDIFGDGDAEDYPYESLRNYYRRSSYGQLELQGNVLGWYTTSYNRADYPGERSLIKEALLYYDQQGHDFTQYDNDGDGVIDYFMVIWSGPHTGWASKWWAHMTYFMNPDFFVDGLTLNAYSWNWESQYGTWYGAPEEYDQKVTIHETGHGLGLPDLYDYNPEFGPPNGVGNLDMMDANWGDHNSFSKFVLEWLTPKIYTSGAYTDIAVRAMDSATDSVIVMPEIGEGDSFQEYFVVENRNQNLNDSTHPGSGLLIWHVDARLESSGNTYTYDNSYTSHKLIRLMEADGKEEIEKGYSADKDDYYVSGHEFGPASTPQNYRYSGSQSGFNIYNISTAGESMTFSLTFDSTPPSAPGWVNDGPVYGADIDFSTSGTALSANWQPAADDESGIMTYLVAIGSAPGATDTLDWSETGAATGVEVIIYTSASFASGSTYYFTVKAKNGAALESGPVSSDGVTVGYSDTTAPMAVYIVEDGTALDTDFTPYNDRLSANWYDTYDYESGIRRYWYAIGTTAGATDVVDWTDNGLAISVTRTGLALAEGEEYFFSVTAENLAGLLSDPTNSNGQTVDTTAPAGPSFVYDGPDYGIDIDETSYIYKIFANWGAASDSISGITGYSYAIGTATNPVNVVGWVDIDTATSVKRIDVALIDSTVYYFSIKAVNGAGVESNVVQSDGQLFRMDKTAPPPPAFVYDGDGADIDIVDSNFELSANWDTTSDPDSGIEKYLYAIGTTAGATDVANWLSTGLATGVTTTGFEKLQDQQVYYFAVRAENQAGLRSVSAVSDGQMVDVFDFDSVAQVDPTTIDVTYSRNVASSTSVVDTSSYGISRGIGEPVTAELLEDNKTVRLTLPGALAECFEYELSAAGIDDGNGKNLMPGASPADITMLGTFYYGDLKDSASWTSAGNPHCIMGDLGIYTEFSLDVGAGTVIKFNPEPDPDPDLSGAAEIFVYGELMMQGTKANPVTMTSAATSPAAGDWGGIIFYSGSSVDSVVSHADSSYGNYAVRVSGGSPELSDNDFSNCKYECLKVEGGAPLITHNSFSACSNDYYCLKTSSQYYIGISGNSITASARGAMIMSPAIFTGNDIDGMADVALGISTGADGAYIKENNFRNSAFGVYAWNNGGGNDANFNYFNGNSTNTKTECNLSQCYIYSSYTMNNPADEDLSVSSMALYRNSAYNEAMGASTVPDSTIYIQLNGSGMDISAVNTTLVKVSSETTDPEGIYLQLMETEVFSGMFRGSVKTGAASDQALSVIGVGLGEVVSIIPVRDTAFFTSVTIDNDTTPPSDVAGVVDGLGQDIATSTVNTALSARWTESTDGESGIAGYWYAVGTSPGATDTIDWTDNGSTRFINLTGLDLAWGLTYYTSVKAENNAGLMSGVTSSNGQTIVWSDIPTGPTVSQGWNFIGVSKQNVSLQTDLFFASGTYEIYSFDGTTYTCRTGDANQDFAMAAGYWIYSDSSLGMLELGGSAAPGPTYSTSLVSGWNAFSLPFEAETEWNDALASMTCGGQPADLPPVYYWSGVAYVEISPDAGAKIYPWQGYWINPGAACLLTINME